MCVELYINHILLFAQNCSQKLLFSNESTNASNTTVNMTTVYDMYTLLSPQMAPSPVVPSPVPSVPSVPPVPSVPSVSPVPPVPSAPSVASVVPSVPSVAPLAPSVLVEYVVEIVADVVSSNTTNTTNTTSDVRVHHLPQNQIIAVVLSPIVILLMLWCLTAVIRAKCSNPAGEKPEHNSSCVPPCTNARIEPNIV